MAIQLPNFLRELHVERRDFEDFLTDFFGSVEEEEWEESGVEVHCLEDSMASGD